MTIKEALKSAMEDDKTYRKYFTLPVSWAAAASTTADTSSKKPSREYDQRGRSRSPQRSQQRGRSSGGKGSGSKSRSKGKGKGKGSSSKGKSGKQRQPGTNGERRNTPDGRQKCFAYNREGCHDKNCGRVHVCLFCAGPHPATACP